MIKNKEAKYIFHNFLDIKGKKVFRTPGSKELITSHYRVIGVDLNPDSKKCVLIKLYPVPDLKDKELICSYNKNTAYNKAGVYYRGIDPRDIIGNNSRVFKWIKPEEL